MVLFNHLAKMNKRETIVRAIFVMAILTIAMTATGMSFVGPALAVGHFGKPSGLPTIDGLPTNDMTRSLGGILDKVEGYNNALSGFPADKINGFGDGLPTSDMGGNPDAAPDGGFPNDGASVANHPEQEDDDSAGTPADNVESEDEQRDTSNKPDSTNPDDIAYDKFKECISDGNTGEGSPTEQKLQKCIDSNYKGEDNAKELPTESTFGRGGGVNGDSEEVSTDDAEE
jgi:hypothetical protein